MMMTVHFYSAARKGFYIKPLHKCENCSAKIFLA